MAWYKISYFTHGTNPNLLWMLLEQRLPQQRRNLPQPLLLLLLDGHARSHGTHEGLRRTQNGLQPRLRILLPLLRRNALCPRMASPLLSLAVHWRTSRTHLWRRSSKRRSGSPRFWRTRWTTLRWTALWRSRSAQRLLLIDYLMILLIKRYKEFNG